MDRLTEVTREMALKSIDTLYRHTAYWVEQNDLRLIVNAYFDITEGIPLDRLEAICTAYREILKMYPDDTIFIGSAEKGMTYINGKGYSILKAYEWAKADSEGRLVVLEQGQPYWYCPNCKEEVDSSCVTYQEYHDVCGCPVFWMEPLAVKAALKGEE